MATAHFFQQSFSLLHWQHIVDTNAVLIALPWGGFAVENVDGTYTTFWGEGVVVNADGTVSGTVTEVSRLTGIAGPPTIGSTIAQVTGTFPAASLLVAYRDGGATFYAMLFDGNDLVTVHGPDNLGALQESPLIQTFDGWDTVNGSIHADTIETGGGNDTSEAPHGRD